MDLYLFNRAKFNELYRCDFYSVEDVPLEERQHVVMGSIAVTLFTIFEILYMPCVVAIYRNLHLPCYKFMLFIGITDLCVLWVAGFLTGYFAITGAVYCTHPTLIYIAGIGAKMFWNMESTLTVILALNRCMDIIWPSVAERLFIGKRSWIWIGVAVIYGLCFAFFGKPVLYTAIYMSWFFYAHVGYSHLHEEEYVNTFNLVHNTFVFAAIISLYSVFLIMYTIKMLKYEEHTMPAAKKSWSKKMIFWQVVIISGAHAASAGLYMYMNYFPVTKAVIYFVSYCWMCTHGIPCVIYLTLNKTIRGACLRMIGKKWSDHSTQPVSTLGQKQMEFIRTARAAPVSINSTVKDVL